MQSHSKCWRRKHVILSDCEKGTPGLENAEFTTYVKEDQGLNPSLPTPSPPTSAPTGPSYTYQSYPQTNCWKGHGGIPDDLDDEPRVMSIAFCEKWCDSDTSCTAFVYMQSHSKCWRRKRVILSECEKGTPGFENSEFTTYVKEDQDPDAGAGKFPWWWKRYTQYEFVDCKPAASHVSEEQSVRDAQECSMYCDSTNWCNGFSIDSTNSPAKCWLLGAFSENAVNSGRCIAATAEQFGTWSIATWSRTGACSDDKDCGEGKLCSHSCGFGRCDSWCVRKDAFGPSRRRRTRRRRIGKAPGSGACSDDKDCGEEKYCAKTCGVYGCNGRCAANWPSRRRT